MAKKRVYLKKAPGEEKAHEAFMKFVINPEEHRQKGVIRPLEPSRHSFILHVSREHAIAIKVATERDKPQNQLYAAKVLNEAMAAKKPCAFFYEPFKVFAATEDYLASEIVTGVSMQALYDHFNEFGTSKQAGHFVRQHPHLTERMLNECWKEINRLTSQLSEKHKIRFDPAAKNIMVRGTRYKKPVITMVDQG